MKMCKMKRRNPQCLCGFARFLGKWKCVNCGVKNVDLHSFLKISSMGAMHISAKNAHFKPFSEIRKGDCVK